MARVTKNNSNFIKIINPLYAAYLPAAPFNFFAVFITLSPSEQYILLALHYLGIIAENCFIIPPQTFKPTMLDTRLKFSFSEKATKICTVFLMVLTLICKRQNHQKDCTNFCGLLRKGKLYILWLFPGLLTGFDRNRHLEN